MFIFVFSSFDYFFICLIFRFSVVSFDDFFVFSFQKIKKETKYSIKTIFFCSFIFGLSFDSFFPYFIFSKIKRNKKEIGFDWILDCLIMVDWDFCCFFHYVFLSKQTKIILDFNLCVVYFWLLIFALRPFEIFLRELIFTLDTQKREN